MSGIRGHHGRDAAGAVVKVSDRDFESAAWRAIRTARDRGWTLGNVPYDHARRVRGRTVVSNHALLNKSES